MYRVYLFVLRDDSSFHNPTSAAPSPQDKVEKNITEVNKTKASQFKLTCDKVRTISLVVVVVVFLSLCKVCYSTCPAVLSVQTKRSVLTTVNEVVGQVVTATAAHTAVSRMSTRMHNITNA